MYESSETSFKLFDAVYNCTKLDKSMYYSLYLY